MKLLYLTLIMLSVSLTSYVSVNAQIKSTPIKGKSAASQVILIITYDQTKSKRSLMNTIADHKGRVVYNYKNFNSVAIAVPSDRNVQKEIRYFEDVKGVIGVRKSESYQLSGSTSKAY